MSVALHPANARRAAAAPPSAGEGAATVAHAVEGKDIDAKMAAAVVRDARQGGASELSIEQCTVLGPGQVLAVVDTSCIATVRICNSVIASGANGTAQSRPSEGAQAGSVRELTLDECGFAPGFLSLADLYRELSGLKSLTFRRSKLEAPPAPGPRGDQRSPVALLARPLALGYCAHLQRVEIGWCSLGTTGTSAVLQQLHLAVSSSPAHMCVREIALPGNGAGDACVPSLAQLLCGPVGRTLRVLDLTSNELTSTGMDTLASRLLQGCRQALGLHVFRCGFNPMGSAALRGIFLCMSVCEHMSEVALPGCELGPEGAPELASGVQSVLMLRTLDLSQNAIGDAGLAQVFKVWQGCESPRGSRADRGGSDSYETSSSGYTSSESACRVLTERSMQTVWHRA
ncbi:unnamed protein product [Pedinophyceae sp. YPF-701]|nr:unnamed protein product [Pedinophyceae sp. YPF-701]